MTPPRITDSEIVRSVRHAKTLYSGTGYRNLLSKQPRPTRLDLAFADQICADLELRGVTEADLDRLGL